MTDKAYYALYREELLQHCVPFWLEHAPDRRYGGILNCLDRTGEVYSEDKSIWMQGRAAWLFSFLYNRIEKNDAFLQLAGSCLRFAAEHGIDRADGRMYFTVTRDGRPLRKRRYWFSEAFYTIANAEYAAATGDKAYLAEAKTYFDRLLTLYRTPENDPYKVTPKYIAETRRLKSLAEPMILLNVVSVLRAADPDDAARYDRTADGLLRDIRCFHSDEYGVLLENVTTDNRVVIESAPCRVVNPGHDMECCWFMAEEAARRGDAETIAFAETVFREAMAIGWDEEYGGLYYFRDFLGKPVEAYEHDMKLWWPHNEMCIAALTLFRLTGKAEYYEAFRKASDYAFSRFSDRAYGEWFGYLHRDGTPTLPACKGHTYKGPFHVPRMLAKCLLLLDEGGVPPRAGEPPVAMS